MAAPARARQGQHSGGAPHPQGKPALAGWRGQAWPKGPSQHGPAKPGCGDRRLAQGLSRMAQAMSGGTDHSSGTADHVILHRLGRLRPLACVDALTIRHVPEAVIVAEQRIEAGCNLGASAAPGANGPCAIRHPNRPHHRVRRSRRRPGRRRPRRRNRHRRCA
jgi:hypothetical protein